MLPQQQQRRFTPRLSITLWVHIPSSWRQPSQLRSRLHADVKQTWHQYKMSFQYGVFQAVPELDLYFQSLFSKPASLSCSLKARANLATWLCQTCVKLQDQVHVSFLHILVMLTNFYCWGNRRSCQIQSRNGPSFCVIWFLSISHNRHCVKLHRSLCHLYHPLRWERKVN